MSRSRKVEPEVALAAATSAFWAHGFHNLGTRQIEEETGITRFTLQTQYGGKKQLFLAVLDSYLDQLEATGFGHSAANGLEGVAQFFDHRGDASGAASVAGRGCLMLNVLVEFSSTDVEINQRGERYFAMLHQAFSKAFTISQSRGHLRDDFDVDNAVEVLLAATMGLSAIYRSNQDRQAGARMSRAIAALLRSWDTRDAPWAL